MNRFLMSASALVLLSACATTELDPIDPAAFVAATPVESETDRPALIVETAVPSSASRPDDAGQQRPRPVA